jgi:hypothetical protein
MSLIPPQGVPPRTPLTDPQKIEVLEAEVARLAHECDVKARALNAYLARDRAQKKAED